MWEYVFEDRIVTFDGKVFEYFRRGEISKRQHIGFLDSAEVSEDRKGRKSLRVAFTSVGFMIGTLTPEMAVEAEKLVADLLEAKAAR